MTTLKASELEAYLDEHGPFKVKDNEEFEALIYIYSGDGPNGAEEYPVIDFGGEGESYRLDTSEFDRGQNDLVWVRDYEPFEVLE